jgi:signal transduction histidine kinase
MRRWTILFLFVFSAVATASAQDNLRSFFLALSELEFEKAKQNASLEKDSVLRSEMIQLADILFYEGQVARHFFKLDETLSNDDENGKPIALTLIRALNSGYVSLFYDRLKGNAFKNFYRAYQLGKKSGTSFLIKTSLSALLKYYNLEIAQNSDMYLRYLQHFERLQSDPIDKVWITVYKMIFYSKSLEKVGDTYFALSKNLDEYEKKIDSGSPILAHVFYEKALKFELAEDLENAKTYYGKTIDLSRSYPFLRYHRFFAFIKLVMIESKRKNFNLARSYLNKARLETDKADTLRSSYHLNLYTAHFLKAQNKNDSAFTLLMKAYTQDFQLDFRRNTLEINRLSIELDTQEKENANLRLREGRTWLTAALAGVGLLFLLSYFAYTNQRSQYKVQLKEKEIQSMRLEKLLKNQELLGIDAMIEGQEKERQRIANDLHDNLGSLLATLKLHFNNLKIKKDRLESENELLFQRTDDLIEEAYQKVRSIAHAKNAGVNAQEGLLPAVKNFAAKVSILNRLVIEVESHGMDNRLENAFEIMIFRVIQELVTNVIKHAQATEATIHLTQHENSINLMVEDNGIGFDISQIKPGETMGLYSIQKRIENLGGQVAIESIDKKGTTVIVDIPLA